jgi:hypothetical protein
MEAETAVLSADRSFFSFLVAAGVAVLDMAPFGEDPATFRSRYTHVYVRQRGSWRFVIA